VHKDLIFKKDNVEYMKLCLHLTLYWTGSVFDYTEGILNFYKNVLGIMGNEFKHYSTEQMDESERLKDDTLNLLPTWLSQVDQSREIITLLLESSSIPDQVSDKSFELWAVEYPEDPAGMVRVTLPTDFIRESPTKLIDLATKMTENFEFHSGHGGYAVNWDLKGPCSSRARKEMSVISRRFPAIDLPEMATTLMSIPYGINRVNWLTLIGNKLLSNSHLSKANLTDQFDDANVKLEKLTHGLMIIAGEQPKLGDVNRQEDIELYHKVGRALVGVRSMNHPPFLVNKKGFAEEEITDDWLAYFDT